MEPTTSTDAATEPGDGGGPRLPAVLQQPLVAAALALVIGLIGGFLIGWKVEQSRVRSDVKDLKARLRNATAEGQEPRQEQNGQPAAGRPQGEVIAVTPESMTIRDDSGEKEIKLSGSTRVDKASPGDVSAITQGARLLVKAERASGAFNAEEIIVLPAETQFGGHTVSAVAADSITTTSAAGRSKFTLTDTTVVNTTAVGSVADIVQGSVVVVRASTAADGSVSASEVVVLPAGSSFIT